MEKQNGELVVHDLRFGKMGTSREADYSFSFQMSEKDGDLLIKEEERGEGFSADEFNNFLRRIFSL